MNLQPRMSTAIRASAAVASIAAVLTFTSAASAQAQPGTFSWSEDLSMTDVGLVPCYPTLGGTLSGTDSGSGRLVETANGIHFEGVETQDYRIDFDNGWYYISTSPTHFSASFDFVNGQATQTQAQQDRGTLYYADGSRIGTLAVWGMTHITWRDLNGNGAPDAGEIRASVDLFKFSCPSVPSP